MALSYRFPGSDICLWLHAAVCKPTQERMREKRFGEQVRVKKNFRANLKSEQSIPSGGGNTKTFVIQEGSVEGWRGGRLRQGAHGQDGRAADGARHGALSKRGACLDGDAGIAPPKKVDRRCEHFCVECERRSSFGLSDRRRDDHHASWPALAAFHAAPPATHTSRLAVAGALDTQKRRIFL